MQKLLAARKSSSDVQDLIEKECQQEFLYCPFKKPPFSTYCVSHPWPGCCEVLKKRLIVDQSSPHDDPFEACSLTYVKIDDAIKAIQQYGRGALLCMFDIANAFKNLPILRSQWPYFCVKWKHL